MSGYEIGTYIDLRHINKAKVAMPKKKTFQQTAVKVGTQFLFTPDFKAARRIPVVFA